MPSLGIIKPTAKGGVTMHRYFAIFSIMIALTGFAVIPAATAWDTSPYVAGTWMIGWTNYLLVNPTTKPVDVYAVFFKYDGNSQNVCYRYRLNANATWYLMDLYEEWKGNDSDKFGAAKFFAFPSNTTKFDPNAVIGGFQQVNSGAYVELGAPDQTFRTAWPCQTVETNLKAVTINSITLREFSEIPFGDCRLWTPPPAPVPGVRCSFPQLG
jgi:hypothetical protein